MSDKRYELHHRDFIVYFDEPLDASQEALMKAYLDHVRDGQITKRKPPKAPTTDIEDGAGDE